MSIWPVAVQTRQLAGVESRLRRLQARVITLDDAPTASRTPPLCRRGSCRYPRGAPHRRQQRRVPQSLLKSASGLPRSIVGVVRRPESLTCDPCCADCLPQKAELAAQLRLSAPLKKAVHADKRLDKPGIYSDGDGLFLRVRDGGSKQFLFIYRRGKTRSELGLGGYGQGTAPVSLALAREKATQSATSLRAASIPQRNANRRASSLLATAWKIC
jgi:hypothetical protein